MQIGEFDVTEPLSASCGGGRCGFCYRGTHKGFLRELASPVLPDQAGISDPDFREALIQDCRAWQRRKEAVWNALREAAGKMCHIAAPVALFSFGDRFYTVTEQCSLSDMTLIGLSRAFSDGQKLAAMRILAYDFARLAERGIVYGEVSHYTLPVGGNAEAGYFPVLVSPEFAFLEDAPPEPEEMPKTADYLSPEMLRYRQDGQEAPTVKSDVFSLALIFHLLLCGTLPDTEWDESAPCEAVLQGEKIHPDARIPAQYRELLEQMLLADPAARPSAQAVYDTLSGINLRQQRAEAESAAAVSAAEPGKAAVSGPQWLSTNGDEDL